MIRKFFSLIFGDWGLLITSAISGIVAALLFQPFMMQLGGGLIKTALAIFLGIFTISFYASSVLTSLILSIRAGISKKWVLMSLSILVFVADVVILLVYLI